MDKKKELGAYKKMSPEEVQGMLHLRKRGYTCENEVTPQKIKRLITERKSTKIVKKIKKPIDKQCAMCYN